jgi:hypothetical protein
MIQRHVINELEPFARWLLSALKVSSGHINKSRDVSLCIFFKTELMLLDPDVKLRVTEGCFPVFLEKMGVGGLVKWDTARSGVAVLDVLGNLVVFVALDGNSLTEGGIPVVANLINFFDDSICHFYNI